MEIKNVIIYFLAGGIVTTLIVWLELSGQRILSGLAALIPIFTLVSYIFIGNAKGGEAVGQHSLFVLVGTIIAWIPYMLIVAYLAPRIGPQRAIAAGLLCFFVLATVFLLTVNKYHLFQ